MATILFVAFVILLCIGMPVGFAMAISAWIAIMLGSDFPQLVVVKEMFTELDSFPLLAVPFFILAAEIMSGGSMTQILLRFAIQFVGHLRGGLGYANVLSSTIFSGISGSALADAAGPGAMMIRMMEKNGYERSYASALTASSAVVGPIIPPSIIMIIYAMQDENVSVGGLFMAGILPGLLISAAMAAVNWHVSRKRNYGGAEKMPPLREILKTSLYALPALSLIVLIIGGIRSGLFTPTEASVMAVFYALFCSFFIYHSLSVKALPTILLRSALVSVAILIILAASRIFAWVIVIEGIPQSLAQTVIGWELDPIMFLLAVNVLLLIFGLCFEPLPGVMVLVPILAPIAHALGIDPTHFAIVVIVNLTIGMITPPIGTLLFVVSSVVRIHVSDIMREMPPFLIAYGVILMVLTFIPEISTWLPRISGY